MIKKINKKSFSTLLLVIIIATLIGIFFLFKRAANKDFVSLNLEHLELADDPKEHAKGLMNRNNLCDQCGMLFEYENEQILSFWMKNTYISLDMIFINQNNEIVTIHTNTTPLQTDPTYQSSKPAIYVLELPAGYTKLNQIKTNQFVDIQKLKEQSIDFNWNY